MYQVSNNLLEKSKVQFTSVAYWKKYLKEKVNEFLQKNPKVQSGMKEVSIVIPKTSSNPVTVELGKQVKPKYVF